MVTKAQLEVSWSDARTLRDLHTLRRYHRDWCESEIPRLRRVRHDPAIPCQDGSTDYDELA